MKVMGKEKSARARAPMTMERWLFWVVLATHNQAGTETRAPTSMAAKIRVVLCPPST